MVSIYQLECEITDNPEKCREVLGVFIRISVIITTACLNLNIFSEIDDQGKIVKFRFINRLLAVVYEVRSK